MKKDKGTVFRYIYGIFLSLFTVFVGALFIRQVWSIYRSAPQSPYTVENISKHFQEIALPVWLWLAAIVGNIALAIAFPETEKRPKAATDPKLTLLRIKTRLPIEKWDAESQRASEKQTAFRKAVSIVCAALMAAASFVCLAVLTDLFYFPLVKKEFFSSHDGLVDRIVQCAIVATVALILACAAAGLRTRSLRKELKAATNALRNEKQPKVEETTARTTEINKDTATQWTGFFNSFMEAFVSSKKKTEEELYTELKDILLTKEAETPKKKKVRKCKPVKEKKDRPKLKTTGVWSVRVLLCAVGIFLIVVGVKNGGMRDVLLKAINICTQCIGLG